MSWTLGMEARLLSTIMGLLLLFPLQAEFIEVDLDKIAGFWREVGVASDQNLGLKVSKRVEGLFLTFSGRNISVKAVYNSSGSCKIEKVVGSEKDTPGEFAFPGNREIHVLDTDYEHYAILRMSQHWQGRDFHALKFFTRSLEDDFELGFWKFRELTVDIGFYLMARHGRCAELLKEGLI